MNGQSVSLEPSGQFELSGAPLETLHQTCAKVNSHLYHVNLDFSSKEDMAKKYQVGLALQPIATALFANSPFSDGKPNGYNSYRSSIWTDVDKNKTEDLPFVFSGKFGFEDYVDYALYVPMYFVYRKGQYINWAGFSFKYFLNRKLPNMPGETLTSNDSENHLTTMFPKVRLKCYVEIRDEDGGLGRGCVLYQHSGYGCCMMMNLLQDALDIIHD